MGKMFEWSLWDAVHLPFSPDSPSLLHNQSNASSLKSGKNYTLQDLLDHFTNFHGLSVSMVSHGSTMLYNAYLATLPKNKPATLAKLKTPILELVAHNYCKNGEGHSLQPQGTAFAIAI